ncbi:uncharacterized protein SCHCODRAFT_02435480, partial [Schizophyllum commune H4-8]|uniref:uncharacterized protein n=1 Tax=Schizophyllum commune (strain H4-8 / FGSC 9210) TaxID=578458 RepID=UPI002160700A
MPQPDYSRWQEQEVHYLIAEQLAYDPEEQQRLADINLALLNLEQREAFDRICSAIGQGTPGVFFLTGPAGTGKTFVYNTLCYALRATRKIVLCVASSGIAAILLIGGRTSHSTFKIPINIAEGQMCNVRSNTVRGDLFRRADLII